MEEKELNLNEDEKALLKILFKIGETVLYNLEYNIESRNGCYISIDSNTLYYLKEKLGIYEIVD